jgi:hypothetical protein
MRRKGTTTCPADGTLLHWRQVHGMMLLREVVPPKPKHKYRVYDATCPTCNINYEVKSNAKG